MVRSRYESRSRSFHFLPDDGSTVSFSKRCFKVKMGRWKQSRFTKQIYVKKEPLYGEHDFCQAEHAAFLDRDETRKCYSWQ